MKTTFRPTVSRLDDRVMPAALLEAPTEAPTVAPAAVVAAPEELGSLGHAPGATADAIWVGVPSQAPRIGAPDRGPGTGAIGAGGAALAHHDNVLFSFGAAPGALGSSNWDPLQKSRSTGLTERDLKTGDILLTSGQAVVSHAIKAVTHSVYSHAALYAGNGRVIEAVGEGVRNVSLKDYLKENGSAMVVRVPALNDADRTGLADFAQRQVAKPYTTLEAVYSARPDVLKWIANQDAQRSSYYCSQLVTAAYKSIGKELFYSIDQTPGDLAERVEGNWFSTLEVKGVGRLTNG